MNREIDQLKRQINGGEAVHIVAAEEGTKGLMISGENGRLLIGMSKKTGQQLHFLKPLPEFSFTINREISFGSRK